MNEAFITEAIREDRYLKAVRLVDQFEEEITRELRNAVEETIEERPELFVDAASPSKGQTNNRTEPLAHTRMQADLRRENDEGDNLRFYLSIEWTQPEIHGEAADGALCLMLYKIKNLPRPEYDHVKQQTQAASEWSEIRFSDDVWNRGTGIFYIPVRDGEAVNDAIETLRQHFYSFSDEFGLNVER
jgi:hypothetical protein